MMVENRAKLLGRICAGWAMLGLLVMAVGGCANAYITKDTDGTLRGPRFYLPRPYIVVLKPFPVAANTWILPGQVTADGVVVSVSQIDKTPLGGLIFSDAGTPEAPFVLLAARKADGPIEATAGGADAGDTNATAPALDTEALKGTLNQLLDQYASAGAAVDPGSAPSGGEANAWIKKGDLGEFRDPVNDLFEIRYLPDLDERYVLVGRSGLGMAKIDAYLAGGWIAQHYGKQVDRRELGRSVFGNVQAVLDIVRAAGKTALIASTGGLGAFPMLAADVVATSGEDDKVTAPPSARQALLRFTVIEHAVPGVYPILKSNEMLSATSKGQSIHRFEIEGSFQQPACRAMPVAYRTTKQLVVSVVRDGEVLSAVSRADPRNSQPKMTWQKVKLAVEDQIDLAVKGTEGITRDHVNISYAEAPKERHPVMAWVTVVRKKESDPSDAVWQRFRTELENGLKANVEHAELAK